MRRQLQDFGFEESAYERPTQNWVCGWSAEGHPCYTGPDQKGCCQTTHECVPYRKGDRWYCSRPKYLGGKCGEGPLPNGTCSRPVQKCRPLYSLRAKRGVFVFCVLAFVFGLLLVVLSGPLQKSFITPGKLTFQHSVIENECSACHTAAKGGTFNWLLAIRKSTASSNDSMLCLKCHEQEKHNLLAHGLATEDIEIKTKRTRLKYFESSIPFLLSIAEMGPSIPKGPKGELACSTCHQEHNGRDYNITTMTNRQCQTCHSYKFKSLADGHPEFDAYPYYRRTRLIFDHVSHQKQHFKEVKKPFNCGECHKPDDTEAYMLLSGFENSCAGCHEVMTKGEQGPAILNIPGLDVETLRERNIPIGEWPEEAEDDLTPFMSFLLSGDPEVARDMVELAKLDLLDLTDASDEQLALVARYAWAVKGLYFDLMVNGHQELKSRLEKATKHEFKDQEISNLAGQLSPETILQAQTTWLPNLMSEMNRHRAGVSVFLPGMGHDVKDNKMASGEKQHAIERQMADNILDEDNKKSVYILEEDEILANKESDDILDGDDNESVYILDEDEILANKESVDILDGGDKESVYILDEDEMFADKKSGDDIDEENKGPYDVSTEVVSPTNTTIVTGPSIQTVAKVKAEEWVSTGGWYLKNSGYSINYQPVGHANQFLRAWLDLAVRYQTKADHESANRLLSKLIGQKAPGRCTKCHSIDVRSKNQSQVNWSAYRPVSNDHKLTRYPHKPHLRLGDKSACSSCHTLNLDADYSTSFIDNDPSTFTSSFVPMNKSHCVMCHTRNETGHSCLSCHNYHVGKPGNVSFNKQVVSPLSSQTKPPTSMPTHKEVNG